MVCVDPVEPFSFGSQCDFTCQEGHYLLGNSTISCLASGDWSHPAPSCAGGTATVSEVSKCPHLNDASAPVQLYNAKT